MHHNMRDGCTTRQDGVFPEGKPIARSWMDISQDRDYAVAAFEKGGAAKGKGELRIHTIVVVRRV